MIAIENLKKSYGDVEAVRGISLEVGRGELFCFLGPNGAGKTTTIKMLGGLLEPTSGSVFIAGINMNEDPEAAKSSRPCDKGQLYTPLQRPSRLRVAA